jgi:hypothetical protein
MIAVYPADAFAAIARDSRAGGTRAGSSACMVGIWNAWGADDEDQPEDHLLVDPPQRAAGAEPERRERLGNHAKLQHAPPVK